MIEGIAPPGLEDVVKKLKLNPKVKNPWAIAWKIYRKRGKAAVDATDDEIDAEIESNTVEAVGVTPHDFVLGEVERVLHSGERLAQTAMGYVEAPQGPKCGTCTYAKRLPPEETDWDENVAQCTILLGIISLKDGCCDAWVADSNQLKAVGE